MTRFSSRYALALGIVLALCLAAIVVGRRMPQRDECPSHAALLDLAAFGPDVTLLDEGPRTTRIELGRLTGTMPNPVASEPLLFAINRAWGLPNRITQPAYALPVPGEPDEVERTSRDVGGVVLTIHHAYERQSRAVRVISYFMTYRGEPIASPFWTRLRSGPAELAGGSFPITLFEVAGNARPSQVAALVEHLDAWLVDAWSHYARVCGAPPAAEAASTSASAPR